MEEPDQEAELDEEIEGNKGKDEASELVQDVEQAEDDPVCQPLFVIISTVRLKGEERHEAGVSNAEQASDISVANSEHD